MRAPILIAALLSIPTTLRAAAAPVDFTREIRPILSQHCFACHGPDAEAREADLSLLTFDDATAERRRGQVAIAPGDLENSLVWQRINDGDDPMPPTEAHLPLSDEQRDLIRRWIDHGASYAPHWAYVPPERVEVHQGQWGTDPIDHWIEYRLQVEALEHAPPADPATLLRRVTTDLTGLPPTTADLDAFLVDPDETAWAAWVDALLKRHHFGERMALYWLDLVRYADTVGLHGDQEHHVWPYRDWVIDAFNANMPFDRFTTEQLAGDLLDTPTMDQLVASTYNRLLQTTHEGGTQLMEYRAIYMADRIRNASAVWMGATVGCAQCHDHKYDPFTTKDYYSMGALFADIDDEEHLRNQYGGLNTSPTRRSPEMRVEWADDIARRKALELARDHAESQLQAAIAALPNQRPAWETQLQADYTQPTQTDYCWIDDVLDTGGHARGDWQFEQGTEPPPVSGTAYRRRQVEGLSQHLVQGTEQQLTIAAGDVLYTWVYLPDGDMPKTVMLQFHSGPEAWEHRAVWGDDSINYGRRSDNWHGHQRMGELPEANTWVRLDVNAAQVGLKPGDVISGWAFTQFDGTVLWDRSGLDQSLHREQVLEALAATERTPEQETLLEALHELQSPSVMTHRDHAQAAAEALSQHTTMLPKILLTRSLQTPREVRILPRGNFLDDSGAVVQPAVPAFLAQLESGERPTRLDFARWLTTPLAQGGIGELTARVLVNRLWALLMGQGLCPSLDDLGGQGVPPVHLELLDMLALDLIESDWDLKAMLRRIVMTETYRQSSVTSTSVARRDPNNHLFARQSRGRLPAEFIRDRILSISELLEDRVGGPSIKPPQPPGLYRHLAFPPRRYQAEMDDEQWRRGLYMHWQRQYLHPMLKVFDAPDRTECTAQRSVSNTPLAALTLLNDPNAVATARALANRIQSLEGLSDRARMAWAMRETTGRHANAEEIDRLVTYLDRSLDHWKANPDAARVLATDTASDNAVVAAAWTDVSRVLLNLHETINRD